MEKEGHHEVLQLQKGMEKKKWSGRVKSQKRGICMKDEKDLMKGKVGLICSYITLIPLNFCYPKQRGWLQGLSRLDTTGKGEGMLLQGCKCRGTSHEGSCNGC